jgi:hypothetical protein
MADHDDEPLSIADEIDGERLGILNLTGSAEPTRCTLPINGLVCGSPLPCLHHPPFVEPPPNPRPWSHHDRPSKAIGSGMEPYRSDFGRLVR